MKHCPPPFVPFAGSPNAYLAELGPDNSMAYTQLQLQRWTGSSWELSGGVLSADQK